MRINREILLKIARDTVTSQTRANRDILSVYLIGSLLESDPLLGGTTDIDLVFVWNLTPPTERTIQPLSDQIHLDIAHHSRTIYSQARQLRQHPWLGTDVARALILFDPQHFMDFTQASVRGLFDKPEYTVERAQHLAEAGRQAWLRLAAKTPDPSPAGVAEYLAALENTANAAACLVGAPIAERRFLLRFQEITSELQQPGLYAGFVGLIGGAETAVARIKDWLPGFSQAFDSVGEAASLTVSPPRREYYLQAVAALLETDYPEAALWPMLRSWTRLVSKPGLPESVLAGWREFIQILGLQGNEFENRIQGLDAYLDRVEELLESWARAHGVWE
jgi:hypothetical protein